MGRCWVKGEDKKEILERSVPGACSVSLDMTQVQGTELIEMDKLGIHQGKWSSLEFIEETTWGSVTLSK